MKQILSPAFIYYHFSKAMEKYSIDMLRISLAIVFIWFGALKVIGMSPAQQLVENTIYWFPSEIFIPFLGFWEVLIGIGLVFKRLIPYSIILLLLHMAGTFLPFFILTNTCFDSFPYCPTMEGQYIIKNLVLISGTLVVGGKYNIEHFKNK